MKKKDETDAVVVWAQDLINAAERCVSGCPEPLKEVAFQIFLAWMVENWPLEEE